MSDNANPQIAYWQQCLKLADQADTRTRWRRDKRRGKAFHTGRNLQGYDGWGLSVQSDGSGANDDMGLEHDYVTVPMLWSLVNTLMPHLFFRNPQVIARPTQWRANDPSTRGYAEVSAALGNYVQREQRKKRENRLALIEALIANVGCTWTDFDSKKGLPRTVWISYSDVLVDPDCRGDISRAKWIARRSWLTLDEILANPRFEHTRDLVEHSARYTDFTEDEYHKINEMSRVRFERFCVWDIWSKVGAHPNLRPGLRDAALLRDRAETPETEGDERRLGSYVVLTMIEGYPRWLSRHPWPFVLDTDEWPLSMLRLHDVPGELEGVSLFRVLEPIQAFLDWMTAFAFHHVRRAASTKIAVNTDQIENPAEIRKLASGANLQVIRVRGSPTTAIVPIQMPSVQRDVFNGVELAQRLFDTLSGLSEIVRGGESTRGKTATQAELEADNAQQRVAMLRQKMDEFSEEQNRKEHLLASQFIPQHTFDTEDGERIYGVDFFLGPTAADLWRQVVDPDLIRAEIVIAIEPGSSRKLNQAQKVQDLMGLWATFGQFLMQSGAVEQVHELMKQIIDAHELPNGEALVPPLEKLVAAMQTAQQAAQAPQQSAGMNTDADIAPAADTTVPAGEETAPAEPEEFVDPNDFQAVLNGAAGAI